MTLDAQTQYDVEDLADLSRHLTRERGHEIKLLAEEADAQRKSKEAYRTLRQQWKVLGDLLDDFRAEQPTDDALPGWLDRMRQARAEERRLQEEYAAARTHYRECRRRAHQAHAKIVALVDSLDTEPLFRFGRRQQAEELNGHRAAPAPVPTPDEATPPKKGGKRKGR